MSQENFEVIRRVITALNGRDIEGYLSCCTEDVRLQPAWSAVQRDYEGPDGIRRFFSDLGDTLPDFRLEIERLEPVRTTRVLALLRVHATARASGLAAGQPEATVGTATATIYDFADGKIERIRVILDRERSPTCRASVTRRSVFVRSGSGCPRLVNGGAATESNLPTRGLHGPAGFEVRGLV